MRKNSLRPWTGKWLTEMSTDHSLNSNAKLKTKIQKIHRGRKEKVYLMWKRLGSPTPHSRKQGGGKEDHQ
jgi:hypothetical protein